MSYSISCAGRQERWGWISLFTQICLVALITNSCPSNAFQPSPRWRQNVATSYNTASQKRLHSPQPLKFSLPELPFDQLGQQLSDMMDVGGALREDVGSVPEAATSMVLESIGRDLLVFLTASVFVTPLCTAVGVTPILGYLLAGALLGSNGLDLFANSKADVELGDFGILFLLFSEGLEVSTSRLKKLANYLPLGLAQVSLTAGVLTGSILLLAPEAVARWIPIDAGLIDVNNPIEALVLALAGTLSTSAFIFPVLKERGWEEEDVGQAATSILLLQDLLVAPLLVILPYVAGRGGGATDYSAIAFLTAKATIGFGSVIFVGSSVLRQLFKLVAEARSTETFVALCLLVSVGMGTIAKSLGLTDTVGAFAAGVLLANTNYRAQIQADILPFKGILLGIFFMDAGTSFDLDLVVSELPTVLAGVFSLIALKAITMVLATRIPRRFEPNRLSPSDGVRVALLLAGGGEFAFVVLALAEKLGVLPRELGSLLTAIVLITMAVTPLLGDLAEKASQSLPQHDSDDKVIDINLDDIEASEVSEKAIVVCGYGEVGKSTLYVLSEEYKNMVQVNKSDRPNGQSLPNIVAFDTDPTLTSSVLIPSQETVVLFGDGSNPQVLRNSGVTDPAAIFVAYEDAGAVISATSRLRGAFPDTSIYARAQTRLQAQTLEAAGATEVIVELDELSRSAAALLKDEISRSVVELLRTSSEPLSDFRRSAAAAAGVALEEIDELLDFFTCMTKDAKAEKLGADDLTLYIRRSNSGVVSDDELDQMDAWIRAVVSEPVDTIGFCRLYERAPPFVKTAFGNACFF